MKYTLFKIQQEFKSSKNLVNDFAKFNYRNLEGMLADLKPILAKYNCIITFNDDIVNVGVYNYIKSTATITSLNTNESISTTAFAREDETKAGMSAGQMTGCGSSYSRKYALCGLCAVNEEKDLDALDIKPKAPKQAINDHKTDTLDFVIETDSDKLKNFFKTKQKSIDGKEKEELVKFKEYYKKKLEDNSWKGDFNVENLWNRWKVKNIA